MAVKSSFAFRIKDSKHWSLCRYHLKKSGVKFRSGRYHTKGKVCVVEGTHISFTKEENVDCPIVIYPKPRNKKRIILTMRDFPKLQAKGYDIDSLSEALGYKCVQHHNQRFTQILRVIEGII